MKKCKLVLILAVTVVLMFTLAACGQSSDISGTYTASIDIRDIVNEGMEDVGFTFADSIDLPITLTLAEDKSFTLELDGDTVMNNFKTVLSNNIDSIVASLIESQGFTEDQFDLVAQAAGYDDYDALKQAMLEQMEETDVSELGLDELSYSGTWSLSGSTLTMTYDDENSVGADTGTVNSDGSISMKVPVEDLSFDITFTRK